MKLALFAADKVGLGISQFLGKEPEPLACLVLDPQDRNGFNASILRACQIDSAKVIYADRASNAELAQRLAESGADLAILAWWPYLISREVIRTPRLGCLNCHPSYLPYGQGKAPNFWALVEGTPFGVTIHFVDESIDSGDIAFQRRVPATWEDTGETLYRRAREAMVRLFIDHFPQIRRGDVPRVRQPSRTGSFHRQRELEGASRIELNRTYTGRELLSLLRARTFPPHPGAWFEEDGERYEVRISITRRKTA